MLFTVFYAAAIYWRRRAAYHKRFMLLARAAALSAATFRIIVQIFGFDDSVAIAGTLAPSLFLFTAMISDYRGIGKIHRVYMWGVPLTIGLIGAMFFLAMTPAGDGVKQAVAGIGRLLRPLY